MFQNQHEHHVQTALAKKGQAKRLHFLAARLKDGDDHEIDRRGWAGKADDLQKMPPVSDRFRVRNEAAGDGHCQRPEKNGSGTGNEEAVRKRRLDGGFHPLVFSGCVVIADQRQRPLRHTLCDGVSQQVDFLGNAHVRDGGIGITRGHEIERCVGNSRHHGHHKAGQSDAQHLAGDVLFGRERFGIWCNDRILADVIEET